MTTHEAFSIECPGCKRDLDVAEDATQIPLHARDEGRRVPVFEHGARFPAASIGGATIALPCPWSGALVQAGPRKRG